MDNECWRTYHGSPTLVSIKTNPPRRRLSEARLNRRRSERKRLAKTKKEEEASQRAVGNTDPQSYHPTGQRKK